MARNEGEERVESHDTPLRRRSVLLELAVFAGIVAFGLGLVALAPTQIGSDPLAAVQGMAGELPTTLPVAVLICLALGVNMLGGAIVLRILADEPYRSLGQAILCGLAGAVLLDLLAMGVLGSFGLFRWPILLPFLVLPFLLLWLPAAHPLLAGQIRWPSGARSVPLTGWLLLGLLWLPPIVYALSSPVVPYIDVPPNHVAPVEHLRTFGALAALDTTPDAYYGPSRIVLGYQGLLAVLATTTGALAVTAVAQFAIPLTGLVALAGWSLARSIGGRRAGLFALFLLPLSVTYFRLNDSRAGVLVFPLVALALILAIEPLGRTQVRRVLLLGSAVGAAILVHPLIGVYSAAFLAVGAALRPARYAGHVWPALAVGAFLAIPQFVASASLPTPGWTVALVMLGALAVADLAVWLSVRAPALELRVAPLAVLGALIVGSAIVLIFLTGHIAPSWDRLWRDNGYLVIVAAALLGVFAWRRPGMELLVASVAVAIAAAVVTDVMPHDSDLARMLYDESPKYVYIVPTLLTIAAAIGLAFLWSYRRLAGAVRAGIVVLVLILAAAPVNDPIRSEFSLGGHGWSEAVSITLRDASRGGLYNFPDWRLLINSQQQELVTRVRQEIDAGRLSANTPVLEVAWSYRLWAATPMAVFTGAMVSTATPDPERSDHTAGGRLHDIAELPALLGPSYPYVVLEPAGLDAGVRQTIIGAGYESIFSNARGEIFALPRD